MRRRVLILGSGKMARNLGLLLVARGLTPSFASRDAARLGDLDRWAQRRLRRALDAAAENRPSLHLLGTDELPTATVVFETTQECLGDKQAVLAALPPVLSERALLLSNSSSILPSEIHPRCAGLHLFYPIERTGFAEVIVPAGWPESARAELLGFVAELGLEPLVQDETSAFAANRLLLPLQAEAIRALHDGFSPGDVDAASCSPLAGIGQLSLLDAVGLDIVSAAVARYVGRMPVPEAGDYAELARTLTELVARGRLGAKNGRGLLVGEPLPLGGTSPAAGLGRRFADLTLNACSRALERKELSAAGVERILVGLLGAERGCAVEQAAQNRDELYARLEALFTSTGRWYFSPATSLRGDRP